MRAALLIGASFCLVAACGGPDGDVPPRTVELDSAAGSEEESSTASQVLPDLPVLDGLATLQPVDEAASDPDFARFRAELLQAVERRDTASLLAVVAPDIRSTFGDDNGRGAFRRRWELDRPGQSEVWGVLERVLRAGGRFRAAEGTTLFMAPYVYAAWPAGFDGFEHVATTSDDAVVRARPDSSATAIGILPYRIVRIGWPRSNESAGESWTEIELPDGRRAWIAAADVYSPVGYRAIFQLRDGAWIMSVLIAGD